MIYMNKKAKGFVFIENKPYEFSYSPKEDLENGFEDFTLKEIAKIVKDSLNSQDIYHYLFLLKEGNNK